MLPQSQDSCAVIRRSWAPGALPDVSIVLLDGVQLWNWIPLPSQLVPAGHPVFPQPDPCWRVGLVGGAVGRALGLRVGALCVPACSAPFT